ncbi:hypothetical protein SAMN05661010_00070 [Modicisalibacter muralis]|uniref:Uncharacterized protein n=1 Tax=Modicisalibacter muralis TaxID=119000 RepID=A0A1G9EQL3_9GAMM|nr:hypothetical protein SAMN05661010_00070 [Halomonas muralis]
MIQVFIEAAGSNWIDWMGALASVVTLWFVAWSAHSQWRTGRNSVQPVFSVWASYPGHEDELCTVEIHNKGFGPAVIQDFRVFYNNKQGQGFSHEKVRDVLRKAFDKNIRVSRVAAMDFGYAMGAGDHIELASFYPPEENRQSVGAWERVRISNEALAGHMSGFSLVIRYSDVYERKWIFVTHQFEGHTFRDKPKSRTYRELSSKFGHLLD